MLFEFAKVLGFSSLSFDRFGTSLSVLFTDFTKDCCLFRCRFRCLSSLFGLRLPSVWCFLCVSGFSFRSWFPCSFRLFLVSRSIFVSILSSLVSNALKVGKSSNLWQCKYHSFDEQRLLRSLHIHTIHFSSARIRIYLRWNTGKPQTHHYVFEKLWKDCSLRVLYIQPTNPRLIPPKRNARNAKFLQSDPRLAPSNLYNVSTDTRNLKWRRLSWYIVESCSLSPT